MVDYSKFSKIEDSDDEPIWQSEVKTSKSLSQQVLDELDRSAERLESRSRPCHCFFDFSVDLEKLKVYAQEMEDSGAKLPETRYLGRVVVELDQAAHAPKLCENFRMLCTGERGTGVGGHRLCYQGRTLDYILPKYCVQASIPNEYSCWGSYLPDENLMLPHCSFDRPGLVAVGNHGPHTNSCTFMVTLNEASHLDGFNQIIGRVVRGMEVLRQIESFPTDRKTQSFAERNVKSHWGGKPMVDVIIESCGEITNEQIAIPQPDGDAFPEHPLDFSVKSEESELMFAQERLREIGNEYFKKNQYKLALAKYKKAVAYLEPLLKKQSRKEFADEEPATLLTGARPKDRTEPVKADCTLKLNICQVHTAMGDWRAAITTADGVLQDLIGKHSRKGYGALPREPIVAKAFFRRAKARIGLSDVTGEVSQLEEAIEDLRQALQVEPANVEIKRELEKVRVRQREADEKNRSVYEKMIRTQRS